MEKIVWFNVNVHTYYGKFSILFGWNFFVGYFWATESREKIFFGKFGF